MWHLVIKGWYCDERIRRYHSAVMWAAVDQYCNITLSIQHFPHLELTCSYNLVFFLTFVLRVTMSEAKRSSSGFPGSQSHQSSSLFKDWECGERYYLERILGKGSYGQVALAMDRFVTLTLIYTWLCFNFFSN